VNVGEEIFQLLLAEQCSYPIGMPLKLVFKETEVLLASSFVVTTANIHCAIIDKIEQGEALSQVTLDYRGVNVITIVPTLLFDGLSLGVGDEVYWMVSPSEISLMEEV
jgi:molybdopterin-binding protein